MKNYIFFELSYKSFSSRLYLRKHKMTHTDENPSSSHESFEFSLAPPSSDIEIEKIEDDFDFPELEDGNYEEIEELSTKKELEVCTNTDEIEKREGENEENEDFRKELKENKEVLEAEVVPKEEPIEGEIEEDNEDLISRNGYLASDIRTHTEEKLFKCDFCPKMFSRKNRLNFHMRIHTEEKHFKCTICSKQSSKF